MKWFGIVLDLTLGIFFVFLAAIMPYGLIFTAPWATYYTWHGIPVEGILGTTLSFAAMTLLLHYAWRFLQEAFERIREDWTNH